MTEHLGQFGLLTSISAAAIRSATPIVFASIGETISQRSGVVNLGVEGMMLLGAMVGVAFQIITGNPLVAVLCAGIAASILAAIHALVCVRMDRNQIISGFALTILGTGLSGFLGRPFVGVRFAGIERWAVPGLKDLPFLGPVLFQHDPLVYIAALTAVAASFLLFRTRLGLQIRAVGEDPEAAYAQAVNVVRTRAFAVIVGGFLAGIGGAHLSLAYTQVWAERMTAGQGWIAIGLVIVAGWRPIVVLPAAYLFGALTVLHPYLQAYGFWLSPYILAMLPYLAAVLALSVVTASYLKRGGGLPAALMQHFLPRH